MTQPKGVNIASGLSANDNAATAARGKRGKKPTSDKRQESKGYPPEIAELTQKIKKIQGQELEARVEIGLELLKAKDLLKHGQFRPWVRREFRWSERTATSYMELARHYEGKTATFADLDLGTALALVTDATLEKVRDEVFERAESGEKIARADVRKQIAEVKATQPKRWAKANTVAPNVATESKASLAADKSPVEEIAEALMSLLLIVDKNKLHCWPHNVAVLFANDDHKRGALANTGSFGFISSITNDLIRMSEAAFELDLAN